MLDNLFIAKERHSKRSLHSWSLQINDDTRGHSTPLHCTYLHHNYTSMVTGNPRAHEHDHRWTRSTRCEWIDLHSFLSSPTKTDTHQINLCGLPPQPLTFQQGPQLLDGTCLSLRGLPQLPLGHLQGHIVQVFQLEAQCKLAQLDRRQLVHVRKHCIDSCGGGRQGIWWWLQGSRYTRKFWHDKKVRNLNFTVISMPALAAKGVQDNNTAQLSHSGEVLDMYNLLSS